MKVGLLRSAWWAYIRPETGKMKTHKIWASKKRIKSFYITQKGQNKGLFFARAAVIIWQISLRIVNDQFDYLGWKIRTSCAF